MLFYVHLAKGRDGILRIDFHREKDFPCSYGKVKTTIELDSVTQGFGLMLSPLHLGLLSEPDKNKVRELMTAIQLLE